MARFFLAAIALITASAAVGQSNGFNAQGDPIRPVRIYNSAGQVVDNFGGSGGAGGTGGTVAQGAPGSTAWPVSLPNGQVVNVGNFPTTQTIAGSVSILNFPASQPVTGTFWQATQPVSLASAPLPTGAATAANQTSWQGSVTGGASATLSGLAAGRYNATSPTLSDGQQVALQVDANGNLKVSGGAGGGASGSVTAAGTSGTTAQAVQGITGGVALPVSGTFFQATQPISAASLPLPTGAATAAGQPSFSTAGSPSTQVLTVQGISGGTAQAVTVSAGSSSIGGLGAAAASGGIASFSRIPSSAASTNATSAKATQGRVFKIFACNTTTTTAYIRFYNSSTAPTVGTSTVAFSRPIPPASAAGGMACASYDMQDIGWSFSVGIAYAITAGAADNDTTALAAGQIVQSSVEFQ
jgi:hypothetical protein